MLPDYPRLKNWLMDIRPLTGRLMIHRPVATFRRKPIGMNQIYSFGDLPRL
jgi:hypothetical protein